MSWLELDDRILDHPKFLRAVKQGGSEAIHLWLGIRAYCGQNLTDGFIPTDMLDEVRGPRDSRKRLAALEALVDNRLIEPSDAGYQMHDFLDWSRSKAEITELRSRSARRSALRADPAIMTAVKERDRGRCRYCACAVDWRDHRSERGGTYDHVTPMSRGGGDGIDNVVTACRKCNLRKSNRLLTECGMRLIPVDNQDSTGSGDGNLPVSTPIPSPPVSSLSSPGSVPPDQTHAQSNPGADGPAILPPPTRHRTARIGTLTPAFLDLFERYPRRDKRMEASQIFAELAEAFPGGEAALAAAISAAFAAGMLNRHPYRGPNETRPCFDRFLAERRWEDPVSAPDDVEPPKPSKPWLADDKAKEAEASRARMEGRRVLAEIAAAENATAAGGTR